MLLDRTQADLSRYTVRRVTMGDLALVNDLYNRCNRSQDADRPLSEARRLYEDHPYGEALILGAFTADNQLAGVLPAIAHRFVSRGLEAPGYQLVDAAVASEHRNRGLFGHLVRLLCESAERESLTVFAFPNERSMSVYRKTGLLQSIGAYETRVKVLAWPAYVSFKLGLAGRQSGKEAPAGEGAGLSDGDVSLVPISRFDQDFKGLHTEMGRVVAHFTLRRKDFLNWRYFGSTEKRYRVALIRQAERTRGYVVVRVIDRIAHVIDVFVTPDRLVARRAASLVARWARRLGAIAVYFRASKDSIVRRAFARAGFLFAKQGEEIVLDSKSLERLTALHGRPVVSADFYFVMGDGDFY